jgi:hypothetical protein
MGRGWVSGVRLPAHAGLLPKFTAYALAECVPDTRGPLKSMSGRRSLVAFAVYSMR